MATGRVNTPTLNLRDQPDGQILAVLTGGTAVEILTPDLPGNWLFVSAEASGKTFFGWVARRFVDGPGAGPIGPGSSGLATGSIFDAENWEKYRFVLGRRESDNKYGSVNSLGFCGRWQFGFSALIDCGYVRSSVTRNRQLTSPDSWLGLNGVFSRADWLSNTTAQDSAMLVYTKSHNRLLINKGALRSNSSIARCAGLLAASHLLGVGGAMAFVNTGSGGHDANGVTAGEYYKLLSTAFGGSGALEP
ncbi:MAG: hypothetical protein DI543_17975 [Bradyrhizobium icense]|nr:MAG: hypothetical protein DI543_17975 [Bradyrhizobium icense]